MSLYCSSNQDRLKAYRKERSSEAIYSAQQQNALDEKLALERGDLEQASHFANLARGVFDKLTIGSPEVVEAGIKPLSNKEVLKSGFDILKNAIANKKLDELMKSIQKIPTKNLSKTEKIIAKDLKKTEVKSMLNDAISESLTKSGSTDVAGDLAKTVIDTLGGGSYDKEIENLIVKSRSSSEGSIDSIGSDATTALETFLSEQDDVKSIDIFELERKLGNMPIKSIKTLKEISSKYNLGELKITGKSGKKKVYNVALSNLKDLIRAQQVA